MRRALQALFLCLAILLGIAGTASGAYAPMGSENRVGGPGANPDIRTYELGSLELEPQGETAVLGYDPATGVVFYVRQNPWTKFDPLGLWLVEKMPKWAQPYASAISPALPIVDGFIDAGIEAKGAYTAERNAGRSVASSAGFSAAVAGTRATGMLDFAEGVNRETVEFSADGEYSSRTLSESEGNVKVVGGAIQMGSVALPLAKGATKGGITLKGSMEGSAKDNLKITDETIREAMAKSDLNPTQGSVSKPIIERDYRMLQEGSAAPKILTEGGKIVDGHHREIAGHLAGKPPARAEGTLPSHKRAETKTWNDVEIDEVDYDNP